MAKEATKYSPGPYEYDPETREVTGVDGTAIGHVYDAADFPCLEDDEATRDRVNEEANATGRLWSAAPDLLAACKWVAGVVRHKSFCPAPESRGPCDCGLRIVLDAISKAEGK